MTHRPADETAEAASSAAHARARANNADAGDQAPCPPQPQAAEVGRAAAPLVVLTVSGGVLTVEAVGGTCRIVVVDLDREGETMTAAGADAIARADIWSGSMADAENAARLARAALNRFVEPEA